MAGLDDHGSLSRVELVVLARLSVRRAPTETEIGASLRQLGMPLSRQKLTDCVTATLAVLQAGALVETAPSPVPRGSKRPNSHRKPRKPSKRRSKPRFLLTEDGRRALCTAFDLGATPTWDETCNRVVPALALGLAPGSKAVGAAFRNTEAMMSALLRRDPALGEPVTVPQLCERIIARALGMPPGPVTLAGLHAYALALHYGVDRKSELADIVAKFAPARSARPATKVTGALKTLVTQLVLEQLGTDDKRAVKDKDAMLRALRRHWMSRQDEADSAHRRSTPRSTSSQLPLVTEGREIGAGSRPSSRPGVDDALLAVVREAIPVIGSDGRYGKENVFVSALWQRVARDRRLSDLSLAHFKRWLVDANRDQLLDLARADLVDAMDARLVEESEIEDRGATFHFVVDHGGRSAPGLTDHAR